MNRPGLGGGVGSGASPPHRAAGGDVEPWTWPSPAAAAWGMALLWAVALIPWVVPPTAEWFTRLAALRALGLIAVGGAFALAATARGLPQRHSSLRRVLEQTWRLLAPAEQDLF